MMEPGAIVALDVDKPTAGGRMLARHHGQVVLVGGAIPGERVTARIERTGKGVAFAETVDVAARSPDRRAVGTDPRCGGNVFAHIAYARQLQLKAEIVRDAFARIGRTPLHSLPTVVPSPETGYRTRARLHARNGRLGFYREGTHDLCDASATRQLAEETGHWIASTEQWLRREKLTGLAGLELAENIAGDQRACHLDLHAGVDPRRFEVMGAGLTGLSAQLADRAGTTILAGTPLVTDILRPSGGEAGPALRLRRDVRAFFQGNRFLIETLVRHVLSLVPQGPVVDLYAGVGLFGLSLAATGAEQITLVEGDPVSGANLQENAGAFPDRVTVERQSVESFLRYGSRRASAVASDHTCILDPPRTGLSRDALKGLVDTKPRRLVYVSCDVATLARDARALQDAGYELQGLTGMDLFPNTAHVEVIAVFDAP